MDGSAPAGTTNVLVNGMFETVVDCIKGDIARLRQQRGDFQSFMFLSLSFFGFFLIVAAATAAPAVVLLLFLRQSWVSWVSTIAYTCAEPCQSPSVFKPQDARKFFLLVGVDETGKRLARSVVCARRTWK